MALNKTVLSKNVYKNLQMLLFIKDKVSLSIKGLLAVVINFFHFGFEALFIEAAKPVQHSLLDLFVTFKAL